MIDACSPQLRDALVLALEEVHLLKICSDSLPRFLMNLHILCNETNWNILELISDVFDEIIDAINLSKNQNMSLKLALGVLLR